MSGHHFTAYFVFAMPIRVTCQCGKSFAAPDNLAGKRVKCPACQQPLAIPEAATAGAAAAAPAAKSAAPPKQPATRAAAPPPAAPATGSNPFSDLGPAPAAPPRDLFAEMGINQQAAGSVPCPSCGKGMPPQAVLCVNCGYHTQLGKRLATQGSAGPAAPAAGGHGGHVDGGTAAMLLARAARSIEEDRQEEIKTRAQGMPVWAYALMLLGLGFVTLIFLFTGIGWGLFWFGVFGFIASLGVQTYYSILMLIHAFTKSPMHGLMCLFVPFYFLYYLITNWNEIGDYFLQNLLWNFIATVFVGVIWLGGFAIAMEQNSGSGETMLWHAATMLIA